MNRLRSRDGWLSAFLAVSLLVPAAGVSAQAADDPAAVRSAEAPDSRRLAPIIGTAKRVVATPAGNGDGSYTLTYSIVVRNYGDVPLGGLQIEDDLTGTFAGTNGFVIEAVASGDFTLNPAYDGSADTSLLAGIDTLGPAMTGTVDVSVTVDAGGELGPFFNNATGSSTTGAGVSDVSTRGGNPDPDGDGNPGNNSVATPISFVENPQIGLAKAVTTGPVNNGDGTYTVTYRFTVGNYGDGPLSAVQVTDDLSTTFADAAGFTVDSVVSGDFTANAGYDGSGDTGLLDGSDELVRGEFGTVDLTVTITPGGDPGPYDNRSFARGTSPGGSLTLDNSVDGLDPDPDGNGDPVNEFGPTPVTLADDPLIGAAKRLVAPPVNHGDGSFTLSYAVLIENFGNGALDAVQAVDDLATTFAGTAGVVVESLSSADLTVNPGYDGELDTNLLAGSDALASGATGSVEITLTVVSGGNLGAFDNSVIASGTSPDGTEVTDTSTDGSDPDPDGDGDPGNDAVPTTAFLKEFPQVGLAKAVAAGPVNNGDGSYTVTYRFTVENFGDSRLDDVQVIEDLATIFAAATGFVVDSVTSADFTPNPGFDGVGDTGLLDGGNVLPVGATGTIETVVTVTPGSHPGPYDNRAYARGNAPGGSLTLDNSVNGADPDPDGDGDPVNNVGPTPVSFAESPVIGAAKSAGTATSNGDGSFTSTYTFVVENFGDVVLDGVQIVDDLALAFADAAGFAVDGIVSGDLTVNPGYDGSADTSLLAGTDSLEIGASGSAEVTITVTPGGNAGPYTNGATGSGTSPAGTDVSDVSTAGLDPDPDGDGDPGNDSTPTTIVFGENPVIGVAKALTAGPVNNGDGSFTVGYTVTVGNFGDVTLGAVQLTDNLAGVFAGADTFSVDAIASAGLTVNAGYDGAADTALLSGTDSLAAGAGETVELTVTVTPGGNPGAYENTVFATGASPGGALAPDNSVDGLDPDPDGNGDPRDDASPTPVTFADAPLIGAAKSVGSGPVGNGDGTFTLTYLVIVENFGDGPLSGVQVSDSLAATYAAAAGFTVDAVSSGDFTANPAFDGAGDTALLAGTDSLPAGAGGTVSVTVTVSPGGNLGPYDNTATAAGTSPAGMNASDDSTAGIDPDPDGDGDPGNDSTPTSVSFDESPRIGAAKSATPPLDNPDGSATLTYTILVANFGDGPLDELQIVEDLAVTFAAAADVVVDAVSSGDFALNPGYDGIADAGLLAGGNTLAAGASGSVDVTVTVTPGGNRGPYDNNATAAGSSPAGTPVSDVSTDGGDPDPDGDGDPGNNATPTSVTFSPGLAAITGNAWLDEDIDDAFDGGESPLGGWLIEVLLDGVVVASVPVSADGSYAIGTLPPGSGYSVRIRHPSSGAVFGQLDGLTLTGGATLTDQDLPIDPSGVVYDAVTRLPLGGVTLTLLDGGGAALPETCLLADQQDQVTGSDGLYRFDVLIDSDPACPSGATYTIAFTVPANYVPGPSALIPPTPGPLGVSGEPDPFLVQPQAAPPTGAAATTYYLELLLTAGDPDVIHNHVPIDPVAASAAVLVSKRADRRQASVGDLVVYTVTVENPGAAIDSLTLSDLVPAGFTFVAGSARLEPASGLTVSGQRPVSFDNIAVPADGSVALRYVLRVGAGVVQGDYTNTVTPLIGGSVAGSPASATVTVTADPDFEQTTIVGKVFDDRDGDGWQDEGEAGIPGVRLATVEGLIIETDAFGRYHLAGVDGGRRDRGRNFIVKVDPASLPEGVTFTTENPRVQRITEGLLNRFDFGVRLPGDARCCGQIDVKIGEIFFVEGSSEVRPEFMPLIGQLADRLRDTGGGTLYIEGHAEPAEATAYTVDAYSVTQHFAPRSVALRPDDRAELDAIIARWRGMQNVSVAAVGHTCNTPIAPQNRDEFRDNYELSRERARTVASYVRLGLGIAPEQVSIAGRGPDDPVASNATPAGAAQNRRVELTISGQYRSARHTPAELARDRANRVLELLRQLLGDELVRNLDIRSGPAPAAEGATGARTGDDTRHWLGRGAATLLGLLVGSAHAAPLPDDCTVDACRTDEGYAIRILPSSDMPYPDDTSAVLTDNKRVDLRGTFAVPVAGGGQLWITEDPTAAEPRLAVHGPEIAPVADGRLDDAVSFFVYANYPAFIARAEIRIYRGSDVDLLEPLAVVPFRPGVFSHVEWLPGDGAAALRAGEELVYRVRVYDDAGRYDETRLEQLRLVTPAEFERATESAPDAPVPGRSLEDAAGATGRGPLDGNVLVLQPPAENLRLSRGSYSLTPQFDTRKTILKPQDRADLDRIVAEWAGADNLLLHVVGHTDNVRIAPENRHEFADNQALSEARARAVADYVASRLGLRPEQVTTEGRAAREPVAPNDTAAGRARNRRVELTLTGERMTRETTRPVRTRLVEPYSDTAVNITDTLEEALNLIDARTGAAGKAAAAGVASPVAAAPAHALEAVYGRSDLRLQRIPVAGSRVRIHGDGLDGRRSLRIDGEPVPLDTDGRYAVEYLVPVGEHSFDVEVVDANGRTTDRHSLPAEVSGRHIFLVALADLTVSDGSISGSVEPLAADDRYDDDLLVEGRLAFYLKGRIRGKYLVTAQLDSREEEIGDLFGNLLDKDPRSVLRRLDPDRYYPVYGDDSTTVNDIDTQGRFYVRADWDRSRATWGNFHTGLTGNEFAQYNRSLYGAQYLHESLAVTDRGKPKTTATAFVSEAQTGFGHSEFAGTGGSLYYLKHQDILPGSEKAWIEIRDRDSGRVRELVALSRGIDYEVDELQGRIILARPLMQVSRLHAPGLVKDTPLDGDDLVLLVDYEYVPTGFAPDKVTAGGRARQWLTDELAIGATLVEENRAGDDYSLLGGDVLWQPGEGTYLKAEYARSEASQAERVLSADGGLTFATGTPLAPGREGDAWSVEARMNSREVLGTRDEWVGGAWYRRTDDDFSVARRDPGVDTTEYGVELTGRMTERLDLSVRASTVERETRGEDRRLSLQADYRLTDRSAVSGELRSVDETRAGTSADGMLLALRYSYALTNAVEVYGIGQFTLDNDSGRYDNNDLATVGAAVDLNGRLTLNGEYSTGHRGEGALLGLDYRLDDRHEVYGTFSQSVDRTDLREPGTRIALGHRSRITDQATLFNERQFVEDRGQAGIAHVFGLDFDLAGGWGFGLSVQSGELDAPAGAIDRDAATVTADYRGERLNWRGKAEYRNENGVSDVRQVLTTNRLDLKLSEDWRLLTRLNHAETEDQTLTDRDDNALFTEAGIGFAYRPVADNRLNLLAKYTFLYDLPAPEQIDGGTDQRSHIFAVEGIYRLNPKWELGGKVAQRSGELRVDRDFGQWFESTTNFFAVRGRYHLVRRWDAMLEYRRLEVDEAGSSRDGWLVAVDRHINDHFRLGVGYNFTDFSDDLTDLDYDHDGWFVNAVGKY